MLNPKVTAFADRMLLLTWTAGSELNVVPDGVDTFVSGPDDIQAQTVFCTLTPKG